MRWETEDKEYYIESRRTGMRRSYYLREGGGALVATWWQSAKAPHAYFFEVFKKCREGDLFCLPQYVYDAFSLHDALGKTWRAVEVKRGRKPRRAVAFDDRKTEGGVADGD